MILEEFNKQVMPKYKVLKDKTVSPKFIETVLSKKKRLKEHLGLKDDYRINLSLNQITSLMYIKNEIEEAQDILNCSYQEVLNNRLSSGMKVSKALAKEGHDSLARNIYELIESINWQYTISCNPTDFFTVNDKAVFKSCFSIGHTYHRSVSCLCNDDYTFLLYATNKEGKVTGKMWFHWFNMFSAYAGVRKYGFIPDCIIEGVLTFCVPEGVIN